VDDSATAQRAKHDLRSAVLAARRILTERDIAASREAVRNAVVERSGGWQAVAGFQPLRTELGSVELLSTLTSRGMRVIVPVMQEDRDLDWEAWSVMTAERPAFQPAARRTTLGRDAIAQVDAVLVPALGVDRRGVRLGRGGGSYDRALRRVPGGVPVAALVYQDELVDELPADPWDVRVTSVVTPVGWVDL
jgi:5-formyltetrahydrofolate cyclo-ligase